MIHLLLIHGLRYLILRFHVRALAYIAHAIVIQVLVVVALILDTNDTFNLVYISYVAHIFIHVRGHIVNALSLRIVTRHYLNDGRMWNLEPTSTHFWIRLIINIFGAPCIAECSKTVSQILFIL